MADDKELTAHDIECAIYARMEWFENNGLAHTAAFQELKKLHGYIVCGDPYPPYTDEDVQIAERTRAIREVDVRFQDPAEGSGRRL